ncbi:hypothetical protein DIPPA_11363 [Diplonema papillatum]|nr:hypothetical protein DIPPA_11363 [Diplonema papillatum]
MARIPLSISCALPTIASLSFACFGSTRRFPPAGILASVSQPSGLLSYLDSVTVSIAHTTTPQGASTASEITLRADMPTAGIVSRIHAIRYPSRLSKVLGVAAPVSAAASSTPEITLNAVDAPGDYTVAVQAFGLWSTRTFHFRLRSPVESVNVVQQTRTYSEAINLSSGNINIGEPFSTQPSVRLLSSEGYPVPGARVVALTGPPTHATNIFYTGSALYHGALAEMSMTADLPLSSPADVNGIASFSNLGFVGGPTGSAFRICFAFLNINETITSLDGVFTCEATSRTVSGSATAVFQTQAVPIALAGGAVSISPVVAVLSSLNVPYSHLLAVVDIVPFDSEAKLVGSIDQKGVVFKGVAAMILDGLTFSASSDVGMYRLKVTVPGSEAVSTGIVLSKTPHALQLFTDVPSRVSVGTPWTIRVAARLADGEPVSGVVIIATLVQESSDKPCYTSPCSALSSDSDSAVTDIYGMATFRIIVSSAMTGNYSLSFSASSDVSGFVDAATNFKEVALQYGGARVPVNNIVRIPDQVQSYAQSRVVNDAVYKIASSLVSSFTSFASRVTVDSAQFEVYNSVVLINITKQPASGTYTASTGNYGSFTVQPVVRVLGTGGFPLAFQDVSVTVVEGTVVFEYDTTVRTDETGEYAFRDLRIVAGDPGEYRLVFLCNGEQSDPSEPITLLPFNDVIDFGSTYVKSLAIGCLAVPWLAANTPGSAAAWSVVALGISVLLPLLMIKMIPGIFDTEHTFVKATLVLTMVLWLAITVHIVRLLVRQHRGVRVDRQDRLTNTYRYVQWIARHVPLVAKKDLKNYREMQAAASIGWIRGCVLSVYNWYLACRYGAECRVNLTGDSNEPTWVIEGGITLHRCPTSYENPIDALRWKYARLFTKATKEETRVAFSLYGVSERILVEEETATVQELTEVFNRPVSNVYVTSAQDSGYLAVCYLHVTIDMPADEVVATAKKKLLRQKLCGGRGLVHSIHYVEDGKNRRDNDSEWTIWDTLALKFYFLVVPVILEVGSTSTCATKEVTGEGDEETTKYHLGRMWVRHQLPPGFNRSNGDPYPDFWSPNYSAENAVVLQEVTGETQNQVPLDILKPEHGGRPEGVSEPIYYPFRFLLSAAICAVDIVVMTLLCWWIFTVLSAYLLLLQNNLPEPPDMSQSEKDDLNSDIQKYLSASIEAVAEADPRFVFMSSFVPTVENVDFVELWKRAYYLTNQLIWSIRLGGIMGTAAGTLATCMNWILLVRNAPVVMKRTRRNDPVEKTIATKALCTKADAYVGLQAVHLVLAYIVVFAIVWIVSIVVFTPWIINQVISTIGFTFILSTLSGMTTLFAEMFVRAAWAPGTRVKEPVRYSRWQLIALIFHIMSALVATASRWITSIVAQTLLFARLDLELFPSSLKSLDRGYWTYHSMMYTDETHNNPIMRVFMAIMLTDYLFKPPVAPPLTVQYIRFVPTEARKGSFARIKSIRVYTDREPLSPCGRALMRKCAYDKRPDFRFYRSPLPVHSSKKEGDGCFICGSRNMTEYFAPQSPGLVSYVRVLRKNFDGSFSSYADGARLRTQEPCEVTSAVINGAACMKLSEPAQVKGYCLKGEAPPGEWRVLGSADGDLWVILHEESAEQMTSSIWFDVSKEPSSLALCTACYTRKRVAEGRQRELISVPLRLHRSPRADGNRPDNIEPKSGVEHVTPCCIGGDVAFDSKDGLTFVTDCPVDHLRGYDVTTGLDADDDPISWKLMISSDLSTPADEWLVAHEVHRTPLKRDVRGMTTPIFPCWPTPAANVVQLHRQSNILREVENFPVMRRLVQIRALHVFGAGAADAVGENACHVSDEATYELFAPRKTGSSFFALRAEREAYRNMRCHKGKWALAFMLVMNPSLLKERKVPRCAATAGRSFSVAASHSAALRMRTSIDMRKWRQPEFDEDAQETSSQPSPAASSPGEMAGSTITVTCPGCPEIEGQYQPSKTIRVLRVLNGDTAAIPPGSVAAICRAYVDKVDLTGHVRSLVANTGLSIDLRPSEGDAVLLSHTMADNAFDPSTGESTAKVLVVEYEEVSWARPEASQQTLFGFDHEANVSCCIHRRAESWFVGPAIPAPGFSFSFAITEPNPVVTDIVSPLLKWHVWSSQDAAWPSSAPLTVSRSCHN